TRGGGARARARDQRAPPRRPCTAVRGPPAGAGAALPDGEVRPRDRRDHGPQGGHRPRPADARVARAAPPARLDGRAGMNRREVERIVDLCVDDVTSGRRTVEECLEAYPELRFELAPLLEAAVAFSGLATVPERAV